MNYAMLLARGRKTGLPAPVITITQQPTNATISNTGSPPYSASLTVAATVTRGTLSYRWEALYDGVWVDVNTTFGVPETSLAYNGDTVIRSYLNYPSNTRVDTLRCVLSAPGAASVISDTATITTV